MFMLQGVCVCVCVIRQCIREDLALVFHTLTEKIRCKSCIVIMFGHTDLALKISDVRFHPESSRNVRLNVRDGSE